MRSAFVAGMLAGIFWAVAAASAEGLPGNATGDFRPNPVPGSGLHCRFQADRQLTPAELPAVLGNQPCLRIGPFHVGTPWSAAAARLGPPHRSRKDGDAEIFMSGLSPSPPPFIAFRVENERIRYIQLTGQGFYVYDFSGLLPGDKESDVLMALGPPMSRQPNEVSGGTHWNYAGIRLEILNGVLNSIAVSDETK